MIWRFPAYKSSTYRWTFHLNHPFGGTPTLGSLHVKNIVCCYAAICIANGQACVQVKEQLGLLSHQLRYRDMGASINGGTPKQMVSNIRENPCEMDDDWGHSYLRKPPYFSMFPLPTQFPNGAELQWDDGAILDHHANHHDKNNDQQMMILHDQHGDDLCRKKYNLIIIQIDANHLIIMINIC